MDVESGGFNGGKSFREVNSRASNKLGDSLQVHQPAASQRISDRVERPYRSPQQVIGQQASSGMGSLESTFPRTLQTDHRFPRAAAGTFITPRD